MITGMQKHSYINNLKQKKSNGKRQQIGGKIIFKESDILQVLEQNHSLQKNLL
jgi:hypothetical protein